MFKIQCAACLKDFDLFDAKRIGRHLYCKDCQSYIVDKLIDIGKGNSHNV